jgi:four helix bundle protein
MKDNVIKNKSFDFALQIIKLNQYLCEEKKEFVLSKQVLRSGTSIGALIREAEQAESHPDFIHKLSISLKEANETDYWIELLFRSGYIDFLQYNSICTDIREILRLLTSIVKTSKSKRND